MADPLDQEALDELEAVSGQAIEPVIASATALLAAIRHRYRGAVPGLPGLPHRVQQATRPAGPPRPPEETVTQPLARIEDEALDLRLRALVLALCEAGVITERAYADALRRLQTGGPRGDTE